MKNITLDKLYKYLEERFAAHDQRFDRIIDSISELEGGLRSEMHSEFEGVKSSIRQLQITVDGLARQYKNLNDERVILHGRVYTLEGWAKEAGPKIKLPFNQ